MEAKIKQINNIVQEGNLYKHEFILQDKGEIQNISIYDTTQSQFQNIKEVNICADGVILERIYDWQLQIFLASYVQQQVLLLPFKQKIFYTNYTKAVLTVNVYFEQETAIMICLTVKSNVDINENISYRARFYNSYDCVLVQSISDLYLIPNQYQAHIFYPADPQHKFLTDGEDILEIPSTYYSNINDCLTCQQLNQGLHITSMDKLKKQINEIGVSGSFVVMWREIQCSIYKDGSLTQNNDSSIQCEFSADIL